MIRLYLVLSLLFVNASGHSHMSRHLQVNGMVALIVEAPTTEGPFDEEESDYIDDSDMTLAALAGSNGLSSDRDSVLNGVPLELTIEVLKVSSTDGTTTAPYPSVEIFLWQTDAAGVYSAVSSLGTEGEKWLRGKQTTNANGSVTFQTILPGWYRGRCIHYHIRLREEGESNYFATSQLFISDSDLDLYSGFAAYSSNAATITPLGTDNIYNNIDSDIRDLLTLDLSGSMENGVTSTLQLGVMSDDDLSEDVSTTTTPTVNLGVELVALLLEVLRSIFAVGM